MSGVNRHVFLSCLETDLSSFHISDKKNPFCDPKDVAATQLMGSIFKKYEDPNPVADAKAISKFLSVNSTAKAWQIDPELSSWDEELLGTFKQCLDNFLHPTGDFLIPSYDALFHEGAMGSGSSLLGNGGDFYTKMFSSKLTVSSLDLYSSYRRSIANLPTWLDAENYRLMSQGGPVVVLSNRTQCVPKNVDISRTICVEPTLNMWYQLGLANIIRKRLRQTFGLDLSTQADVNRELARRGSMDDGPDSFVTIDLESASDSISLGMVRFAFPKWFVDLLMSLRCSHTIIPSGERVELGMVSTMGNGFTFPLQTLIFSAVVSACYREQGITQLPATSGNPNWAVFGDDIVVVRKVYNRVLRLLAILGFTVNTEKSFFEGPFRESCGSDFYKGHFVRPVYIRRLDGVQDTYVAFNKLVRWSERMGINIPNTLQYLLKKCRFNPVPMWESDDAGIKVPSGFVKPKYNRATGSWVYKAYVPKARRIKLHDDFLSVPRFSRKRDYNPSGLIVAITRGEFRDGEITPRLTRCNLATTVRRTALNWDVPPVSDLRGFLEIERVAFSNASVLRSAFGEAVWPIAGHVDGRRWKTVFTSFFNQE